MKRIKLLSILLMAIFSVNSYAQDSDLGNWLIYLGNKKIDSKWNWHHEIQYRNYNAIGDLEQLLLRTGIGYNLTENNNNLLLGYGFINSQNYINSDDKVGINEHRIYQQFVTRQTFSRVKIQHRYRFEQRFIEDVDFKMRFRYFLSINVPINHPNLIDKTWYASAYNEIFINNEQSFFGRNRLYLGVGYRLNKNAKFEVGYMNQFFGNGSRDQVNLITFINF